MTLIDTKYTDYVYSDQGIHLKITQEYGDWVYVSDCADFDGDSEGYHLCFGICSRIPKKDAPHIRDLMAHLQEEIDHEIEKRGENGN